MLYMVTIGKGSGMQFYYVDGENQAVVFDYIWKEHQPKFKHDKISIGCLSENIEKAEGKHI